MNILPWLIQVNYLAGYQAAMAQYNSFYGKRTGSILMIFLILKIPAVYYWVATWLITSTLSWYSLDRIHLRRVLKLFLFSCFKKIIIHKVLVGIKGLVCPDSDWVTHHIKQYTGLQAWEPAGSLSNKTLLKFSLPANFQGNLSKCLGGGGVLR